MRLLTRIPWFILPFFFLLSAPAAGQGVSQTLQQQQDSLAQCKEHDINDQTRGNIKEFRDQYLPTEYFPLPEYMVFVDLGVLALIIAAGIWFVMKRKHSRYITLLMIITFVYLAFIRGGCICPVGLITNATMGIISPKQVGLAAFVVFIVPLLVALFAGRIFCSAGCPLGSVQHLAPEKRKQFKLPLRWNKYLRIIPVLVLILTVVVAVGGKTYIACEIDPYKAIFFTGQAWFEQGLAFIAGRSVEQKILFACGIVTWIYLTAILVLGYWVPRPFCRFICPYGVLLGIVSVFSFRRRQIDNESCNYCRLCEKECPTQAIIIDRKNAVSTISHYDCIQCNRCSDRCKSSAIGMKKN
jgi:polyferredoxin